MSTTTSQTPTVIKIWSDISCPFCIIGKSNMDQALESLGLGDADAQKAANVQIEWKSFQLSPDVSKEELAPGQTYYHWLGEAKGWPLDHVMAIHQRVKQTGKEAGVDFNFDAIKPSNTRRLHQLIKATQKKNADKWNVSHQVEEIVFAEYFKNGTSTVNFERYAEVLKPFNMSVDDIKAAYADQSLSNAVDADIAMARKMGVNGVPFFVFDDKAILSGAQPPAAFQQVLKKVITPAQFEAAKAANVQVDLSNDATLATGTCRPDGTCD